MSARAQRQRGQQPKRGQAAAFADESPSRWRAIRGWVAGGAAVALVATIAVVSSGFDARETPREVPSVWVTREAGQYARVNTETGEIDTVRKITDPSAVVQAGAESVIFSNGNGRAWPVNAAQPVDLAEERGGAAGNTADQNDDAVEQDQAEPAPESEQGAGAAVRMPDGTREVIGAGRYVLVRTESGAVYFGTLSEGAASVDPGLSGGALVAERLANELASLELIDPLAEEQAEAEAAAESTEADDGESQTGFIASAIALTADGSAAMFSSADGTLWRYDAARARFTGGAEKLPDEARGIESAQLALVAGDWVLLDAEAGTLWRQGSSATTVEVTGGARLQASGDGDGVGAGGGDAALVADVSGLWRVPAEGAPERIAEAEGTPAQPTPLRGVRYAAWIGQSGGQLWRSDADAIQRLDFDESVNDPGDVVPTFFSNGARAVLGEARTGMLWTLPEGRLIPLSQWSISDPPKEDRGTVVVEEVAEQVPPVAVSDSFGVRAGEPAPLPVLLNDYDSNKRDVLTIVPESLGESPLPSSFGTVELLPDGQSLMVHPAPGATGTATFGYRLSDGALSSEFATVSVTVVGDETNSAPEWCPVEGCQRAWGVPPIAPGGTLVYPILEGWVDPQGDPMMLEGVESLRPEDPVRALVAADGKLAVRHTDVNAGASEIMLRLTVRDGRGASAQRDLQISVQPNATPEFMPMAATVQVGQPVLQRPLIRVAGGSGSFVLTDATVQLGGERLKTNTSTSNGTIELTATEAGEALISLGIRDTVTGAELTGVMRVTALPGATPLALPPLRAFVRPLADSTVEILDAIPGANARGLSVQAANVVDGQMRADVVEHSKVRVSGSTADGAPGRIGSADIVVNDGGVQRQGRLTVFQVAESGGAGAIAVADDASVRAGSVVDIRVLDNDVAPPGERLILHPEVTGSGAAGELAFASGSVLRYLAPESPGTYRLSYTTYGASSPEASDVGTVTVTVLPKGANRDPEPQTLTARVAPGEQVEVRVPLSGVDADGDRVRLIGVGQIDDPQVNASIGATGATLNVAASTSAAPGVRVANYSVRDGFGGTGTGKIRIVVTPPSSDGRAPIASTDYVRVVRGDAEPVVVRPLDNDIDPANGSLVILSVTPNVPGGESNPSYQLLSDRLDVSKLKDGIVAVLPGEELGTVSYKYTVKSSASSSTSDGLILVQASERVGAQAPSVTDTVLNVRDRAELPETGVDVLTDKVRWAAGDPSSLSLSLWEGNDPGYRVESGRVLGKYNPDGDLVVFRLDGVDASGTAVTSYGFLIIPPLDELRVTLKPGLAPLSVDENKSAEVSVRSLVELGPGDRIEMREGAYPVGRSQASCAMSSEDQLRYSAGAEAPWEDTCLISLRLVGQKSWTSLPVPINIVPRAPIVQLDQVTRTVAPGGSETIDLMDMVRWQGDRAGDTSKLRFDVSGGGSLFTISPSGQSVTVDARADATPGSQEALTIGVSGQGDARATLMLRIGEAPRDAPKGGTVKLTCTVGSNCGTNVIGAPGEYDPFAGKRGGGLKLDTVSGAGCTFGTISRSGDQGITVAWPDNRGPGGSCTVGFTVRDAQGRSGEGAIEFDAQGVPRAPASLSATGFTGNSVTFIVELGAAQSAHPAVSGIEISGPGSSSCSPAGPASYQCVVTGLENGTPHEFTARAVNSVGASDPTSSARAWAYQTPAQPQITKLVSVAGPGITAQRGLVEFSIMGDSDVKGYRVTIGGETFDLNGREQTDIRRAAPVGGQVLTVVPLSKFQPPSGASLDGTSATQTVNVAGTPKVDAVVLSAPDNTSIKAQLSGADANFAPTGDLEYAFTIKQGGGWGGGGAPGCPSIDSGAYGANDHTFTDLKPYKQYSIRGCVSNGFGIAEVTAGGIPALIGGGSVPLPSGTLSYTVNAAGTAAGGNRVDFALVTPPAPVASEGAFIQYNLGGVITDTFALDEGVVRDNQVRQCLVDAPESCSDWKSLTWTGAATVASVQLTGVCVDPANPGPSVTASAAVAPYMILEADATGKITVKWAPNGSFSLAETFLQGTLCAPEPPDPPTDPPTTP